MLDLSVYMCVCTHMNRYVCAMPLKEAHSSILAWIFSVLRKEAGGVLYDNTISSIFH